jgi:DNA-directed RNA polymerase beta subunit
MTGYTIPTIDSSYQADKTGRTIKSDIKIRVVRSYRNADGTLIVEGGVEVKEYDQEGVLVSVPVLRGSKIDPIKSRLQRYEKGDDPLLPDGYFTIDGRKQYIVQYNKLKYDMPLTFLMGDGVCTQVVCTTPDMSTVQIIVAHNAKNELLARTSILGSTVEEKGKKGKRRYIPLYEFMTILMTKRRIVEGKVVYVEPSVQSITDIILSFVPDEHKDACRTILFLSEMTRDRTSILTSIKSSIRLNETIETIERKMKEEVYPAIPLSEEELKAKQFGYLASRHVLYLIGELKEHDRDAPGLFRMDSPEIVITKLIADKFRVAIDAIKTKGEGETGIKDLRANADTLIAKAKGKISITELYKPLASLNIMNNLSGMRDDVITAFKKGNFGGKNIKRPQQTFKPGTTGVEQKGIVAALDTTSYSAAWSNMSKRGIPTSSKGKSIKVRSGHPGRVGYEDLLKSPDSHMIGLVVYFAMTCWESSWKDPTPVIDAIGRLAKTKNNLLPQEKTKDAQDLILVAGIIQGYADGKKLVKQLNELRQNDGPLAKYFDSMFFYDNVRKEVQILTDAGRLTRPMLVVDGDQLVIDKKNLPWNSTLEELLSAGAMRFVDSYEPEFGAQAAQFPGYFRVRWDEIYQAEDALRKVRLALKQAKGEKLKTINVPHLIETLLGYRIAYKRGIRPEVRDVELGVAEANRQVILLEEHIARSRSLLRYDYCEIDADAILGFSSAIVPYINHTSGTKEAYAAHMSTQASGQAAPNFALSNAPLLRLLNNGQRGMSETGMASIMGLRTLPASQNVVMAILSGTAYGDYGGGVQEDAIQVAKSAVDRGLFNYTVHKRVAYSPSFTTSSAVRSSRPSGQDYSDKYANLDSRGVVIAGTEVKDGDVLYSVEIQLASGRWKRKDVLARPGENGIVTDVYFTRDPLYIQIRLSEVRKPTPGTKLSSMHANKGVIVEITEDAAMPYDPVTGLRPDVIVNPIGLPTRGTTGLTIEMITGMASALLGQRANACGMNQEVIVNEPGRVLEMCGFDPQGETTLVDARSGEKYRGTVSMGICQMQFINMTVEEIANWVGVVNRHPWSMQPVKSKKKGGGIRMGVTEGDGLAYHSMEAMRRSVYYLASDGIQVAVCKVCGRLATASQQVGHYQCTYCTNTLPPGEAHKARDIARVEMAGSWRHIQQVLIMRGIEVTHQLREPTKRTE